MTEKHHIPPPAPGNDRLTHQALIYGDDETFLATTVPSAWTASRKVTPCWP
ncbi:hypothetical protein [Streptomyces sp. NPDC127100]|uniref:hypothetical protein n=1 Tax=Streptomyces sp. NPDC127100 TaxID=3347138 RepID=UPI0036662C3F